ncbi:MAG TPA: MoxR family ATPase, partial [Planctomycetaceae bacterium]|nr:MoxR family ATPase [Planctomycetaceae bacterium]
MRDEISKVIFGQDDVVELALAALFSSGHVLLEGPPGTAKTLLVRTIAAALNLQFRRVQMTPDLLPG